MTRARLRELETSPPHSEKVHLHSPSCPFWLWPNLLSLDAVCVALLWQQLFAQASSVSLALAERAALALAVWAIYIADRALDSSESATLPSSRHVFYARHKTSALVIAGGAIAAEVIACSQLSVPILLAGLLLSAIVAFHFVSVHTRFGNRQRSPKELRVAMVFAAGTVLVPFLKSGLGANLVLPALLFASLCALNCAGVEYQEWRRFGDSQPEPSAFAVWLTRSLSPIAAVVLVCAVVLLFRTSNLELSCSLAISSLALICFDKTHSRLSHDAMRVAADLCLLAPALLLLFQAHEL